MLKNHCFFNKNCDFSICEYLLFLLYLGQFLSYIDPLYHFGILKVSSLSICKVKFISIIIKKCYEEKKVCHFFYQDSSRKELLLIITIHKYMHERRRKSITANFYFPVFSAVLSISKLRNIVKAKIALHFQRENL